MSKQSTYTDGIMIAAAVDLYQRTVVIVQDDGARMDFTYNGDMSSINKQIYTPIFLGYIKTSPLDTDRNHYLSLYPIAQHQLLHDSATANNGVITAPSGDQKCHESVCNPKS